MVAVSCNRYADMPKQSNYVLLKIARSFDVNTERFPVAFPRTIESNGFGDICLYFLDKKFRRRSCKRATQPCKCTYARSTFDPRAMSSRVLRGRTYCARFRAVIRDAARGRTMETDGRS